MKEFCKQLSTAEASGGEVLGKSPWDDGQSYYTNHKRFFVRGEKKIPVNRNFPKKTKHFCCMEEDLWFSCISQLISNKAEEY